MGIHFSDQARITDDRTALAELIVKEYLTFPVLLSEKEFPKVTHIVSPRKIHFVVDYSLKLYALFVKFFFCLLLRFSQVEKKCATSCSEILRIL